MPRRAAVDGRLNDTPRGRLLRTSRRALSACCCVADGQGLGYGADTQGMPSTSPRRLSARRVLAFGLLVGVAAHASHAMFRFGGHSVDRFFEDWLLNALIIATSAACLLRGLRVRAERLAWIVLGVAMLSWSGGFVYWTLFIVRNPTPPYPSPADALWLDLLPGGVRRAGADHSLPDPRVSEEPVARRAHRRARGRLVGGGARVRRGPVEHRRQRHADRGQPRVPARGHVARGVRREHVRADGLAPGPRRAALGDRLRAERRRRFVVGLLLRHRHVFARIAHRDDLAGRDRSDRPRGLAAGAPGAGRGAERAAHPRRTGRLWDRGARRADLDARRAAQRHRADPRGRDAAGGAGAPRVHAPRALAVGRVHSR